MYVDLDKLVGNEEIASIIIRLMMACNDLTLTNTCLGRYRDDNTQKNKYINDGACMYFIRLQIGHLYEGLKIIKEIYKNKRLKSFVDTCSPDVQTAFKNLCKYIPGGQERKKFEKYFGNIRHNLTFHYHESGVWIKRALRERINKKKQKSAPITLGAVQDTRYQLADQIVDTIVCRNIFGISYDIDLQSDTKVLDEILLFGSLIARDFVGFTGEFIHNYIENNLSI